MARFTPVNARLNAAKSHAARRSNAVSGKLAAQAPPQVPQSPPLIAAQQPDFVASRLVCVREQLAYVDELIKKETDPRNLDRLTAAQFRLSQQEFALAGRPMPGQYRPKAAAARQVMGNLQRSFGEPAALLAPPVQFEPPPAPAAQETVVPVHPTPVSVPPPAVPVPKAPPQLILHANSFRRAA